MKKYFKAMATLTDGSREWNVCICSQYKSEAEAAEGISCFASHGYSIVKTWIE